MMNNFKKLVALLIVCQLACPWTLFAASVGEFLSVTGDVRLTRDGKVYKAVPKSAVEVKDLIVTGSDGSAKLLFTDESTILLSPNSEMEVQDFSLKDKTRQGSFFMRWGKLVADVKKFIGGNSSFVVKSPTAVAGVRGTGFEFVVTMVGTQMTTSVTCTTGALTVSALSSTGAVLSSTVIMAGQTAIITSTGITVTAASAAAATGTTVTTASGTGTVATTAGAGAAGASAGSAAVAGVGVGTVAVGTAAAAAIVAGVASSTSSDKNTPSQHTTTIHH